MGWYGVPGLAKVFITFLFRVLDDYHTHSSLLARLLANDRVNPYVSVYECPVPSYIGDITHLRWNGFLGPEFVQSLINTALYDVVTNQRMLL